ncbi:hypothetical protein GCM10009092_17480 [Bowmanella denitrificans]|uniref:DUF4143 domain-containing protein n=1 Tax=Bowmanella denitrificans TaxID=366582 RepID=A0ABN0X2R7_9ALTE
MLELLKNRYNQGLSAGLYYFRDSHCIEVDILYKIGEGLTGIEIKSAATWNSSFLYGLKRFPPLSARL